MKKLFRFKILIGMFLSLCIPHIAFSQGGAGLTNSGMTQRQEMEAARNQAGNGFDYGGKSGSALQQLENISGRTITGNHSTVTPASRATPVNVVRTLSTQAIFENALKRELASGIANAFIGMLFNSGSSSQNNQKALEAQRQQAAILAQRAEAERRYNDSISQVKYEKMMQSYKLLNDPNGLQIKTLSSGNLQFKSLDGPPAPMSQAEKERQNLLKRGISVTMDPNSWTQMSPNSYKIEETANVQEEVADKYLNDAINKIETFQGGRIAALAGRYMLNIKKETMSYLKDASSAAISGNIARMEETGNVDLRAKISSNALYTSGVQTAKANFEQGKDFVTGKIDEAKDAANFAIMESKGAAFLEKNNIYSHVSDEWKVNLRKY